MLTGTGHALGVPGAIAGNTAIGFDGHSAAATDDGVLIATNLASYSVESWIKLDGALSDPSELDQTIWSRATNVSKSQVGVLSYFTFASKQWSLLTSRSNNEQQKTSQTGDFTTAFVHIVTTFDGTTLTLWVNGEEIQILSTLSLPQPNTVFRIGASDDGANFVGAIDEVAVYDYALTGEQIQAHRRAAALQ